MTKPSVAVTVLLLLAIAPPSFAFTLLHLGVRGGVSQSNLRYDLEGLGTNETTTEWGPAIGVFAEAAPLDTPIVTVEMGALFTRNIHVEHYAVPASSGASSSREFPLEYVSFPLLVRIRLIPRAVTPHILFGPSFAVKLEGGGTPILDALEDGAASLVMGVGAQLLMRGRRVEAELRYSYGVTGSGRVERPIYAIRNATCHSTLILIGVGF